MGSGPYKYTSEGKNSAFRLNIVFCVWKVDLRECDHLRDLGVDGRIILKWIFKRWD
jgi:hypothetical protein